MAVTSHVYPLAVVSINEKTIDLHSDTFKALLCTGDASTWGSTQEAYQFVSDVTTAYTEVSDADYARVTLTSPAVSRSGNVVKWTASSPISWGSSVSITARSMFIFDSSIGSAVDSATPLICVIDFGTSEVSSSGTFEYTIDASGLATWTES